MSDETNPVPPVPNQPVPSNQAPPPPPPPAASSAPSPQTPAGYSTPHAHSIPPGYGSQQPYQQPPHHSSDGEKKGWVIPTVIGGAVVLIGAIIAATFLWVIPALDSSEESTASSESSQSSSASDQDADESDSDIDSDADDALTTDPDGDDSPDALPEPDDTDPAEPDSDVNTGDVTHPSEFHLTEAGAGHEFDPNDPKLEGDGDIGELIDELRDKYSAMDDDESLWEILDPTAENIGAYIAFQYILTDMRNATRFGTSEEQEIYFAHQAKYLESLLMAEEPLGTSIKQSLSDGTVFEYDGDTGVSSIE